MFIHPQRNRHRARLMLALVALLTWPAAAGASDGDAPADTEEGWRKVVAYARCAFVVFTAVTPVQWTAAFLDCGKQFVDEPPLGAGGL